MPNKTRYTLRDVARLCGIARSTAQRHVYAELLHPVEIGPIRGSSRAYFFTPHEVKRYRGFLRTRLRGKGAQPRRVGGMTLEQWDMKHGLSAAADAFGLTLKRARSKLAEKEKRHGLARSGN